MREIVLVFFGFLAGAGSLAAQSPHGFDDSTTATAAVVQRYIDAYFAHRIDDLAAIMHQDITFEDPTAAFLFSGGRIAGRENVVANFRLMYQNVLRMTPTYIRTIVSSNTAVFELSLDWDFISVRGNTIHIITPLVVILSVQGGAVIEHRDYGDYTGFLKEYRRQNE